MTSDVGEEIREILEKGQPQSSDRKASINVVVGNGSTVVIGNGNDLGRREEDKPGKGGDDESHGRRSSDRALHRELRSLRHQVHTLVELVASCRCLNASETPVTANRACLTSSRPNRRLPPNRPSCLKPARATLTADRSAHKARHCGPRSTIPRVFPLSPAPRSPVSYHVLPLTGPGAGGA